MTLCYHMLNKLHPRHWDARVMKAPVAIFYGVEWTRSKSWPICFPHHHSRSTSNHSLYLASTAVPDRSRNRSMAFWWSCTTILCSLRRSYLMMWALTYVEGSSSPKRLGGDEITRLSLFSPSYFFSQPRNIWFFFLSPPTSPQEHCSFLEASYVVMLLARAL